jgi:hypothetical protein
MGLVGLKTLSNMHEISVPQLRKLLKKGLPHCRADVDRGKILVDPKDFLIWFKSKYSVDKPTTRTKVDEAVKNIIEDFKGK